MKKKSLLLALCGTTAFGLTIAAVSTYKTADFTNTSAATYVLTLDSNKKPTLNSGEGTLKYNDYATFTYSNAANYSAGHVTLNTNGQIKKDRSNGLSSFSANFSGSLVLYTAYEESDETWTKTTLTSGETYTIGGNFFKIICETGTSNINSFTVRYNCGGSPSSKDLGELDSTVIPDENSVEDTREKDVQARELCNNFNTDQSKSNETTSALNWFLYKNKESALSTSDLALVKQTVKSVIAYNTANLKFDIGSYFENVYYSELLLMAKKTSSVWSSLTTVEQEKANMAMDTYAYLYSIATDDNCNYLTGVGWTGNYSKTGLPNVRINNLLPLIYSYFYYDLTDTTFNSKLSSFSFDSHLARIQSNGATTAYTTWTATSPESTVTQKTFLENGGQVYYFNNGTKTDGGTGIGIPAIGTNGYKYNTYTLSQWSNIFQNVGENTYSGGTCISKFYTTAGKATAYILDNKTSTYEDCKGMMTELNYTDTTGFNSLTTYASLSFEGVAGFLRVLEFTGKGEFTTTFTDAYKKIVYAGNQDFLYKYKNGYFDYSSTIKTPKWMASDKVCTFYADYWGKYDGLYNVEELKGNLIIYGVNSDGTGFTTIGSASRTTDTVTVGSDCSYIDTTSEGQKTIGGVTFNAKTVEAVLNTSQGYEGNKTHSVKVVLASAAKVTVYVGFSGTAADTYAKYMVDGSETRITIGEKFTTGDHALEVELNAGTYYFGVTKKAASGGRFYGIKIADK